MENLLNSKEAETIDGHILSRYKILEELGKGAYGIVWKAQAIKTRQFVALKKIIGAFNNDVDAQRTWREVLLLKSLCHPLLIGLLKVYAAANDKDLYLVFPYVETNLHLVNADSRIEAEHKQFIIYQLFLGLKYLKDMNVLHRDLKPCNILINSQCQIKIADFGLARTISAGRDPTGQVLTEYVATKYYRSPEILLGGTLYSFSTDIWSTGCIIAELFSKAPLFKGGSILEHILSIYSIFGVPSEEDYKIIGIAPNLQIIQSLRPELTVRLSSVLTGASKDLLHLIERCLTINPEKRITVEEALLHPYFTKSAMFAKLKAIPCHYEIRPFARLLDDNVRLNYTIYREELYRLIKREKEARKRQPGQRRALQS
jgi:mitogen-activated protein kinase 15